MMTRTGDIIPEVGQVWECRSVAVGTRKVSILAVDHHRKECIISWNGMAQADRVTFEFLNEHGTLLTAAKAEKTLQIKDFDNVQGETNG